MTALLRDGDGQTAVGLVADRRHVTVTSATGHAVARVDSADELMAALADLAPPGTPLIPMFAQRPWPTHVGHAVLLLALTARWPWLVASADLRTFHRYHLTLAYALPLALDTGWRRWSEHHADLLIRGGQLVLVPADDLVAVQPDRTCATRHRRLLRRHADTDIEEHHDHADFLRHWSAFTQWRHGRPLSEDERTALRAMLEAGACTVREFINRGEVIARSVICAHTATRTIFDLMATWHPRHTRLRPGIYSAVHNLIDTAERDFRFSLCYGQFPYKDDIVGSAERLALEDLMFDTSRVSGLPVTRQWTMRSSKAVNEAGSAAVLSNAARRSGGVPSRKTSSHRPRTTGSA